MKKKFIVLLGIMASLLLAACSSTAANVDGEAQSTSVEENANASSEAEQSEPEETGEEGEAVYAISESAILKDWEISVTDMQIVDTIAADYGTFSPNESGNKYVQVFVTVYNNGKQADNFLPTYGFGDDVHAKVLYGDGYEFSATNLLGYSNELHDSTINPLSSKTGEIAFEVPETVAGSTDELILEFISGSDAVKFKIR